MKSKIWLLIIAFIFMASSVYATEKVVATNNQECVPANATFTVPQGMIAVNFKLISLDNGYNCHTHVKLKRKNANFYIKKSFYGNSIYTYASNKKNFNRLQLKAGKYYLIVDGGIRTKAVITYTLKKTN